MFFSLRFFPGDDNDERMSGFSEPLTDAMLFGMDAPGHSRKEKNVAEIKSTLDLIMERTKNLTLTEEEKGAIRTREGKAKARGWFQRYSDGALSIRDLEKHMEQERASFPEAAALLREECLAHVDPEGDNQKIFQIMEEILAIDPGPFQSLVDHFQEELGQLRSGATRDALDTLHAQGVSGTAVIPNLNISPVWNASLESARKQFRKDFYLVR